MSIFLNSYSLIILGCLLIILCAVEGAYSLYKSGDLDLHIKFVLYLDLPLMALLALLWLYVSPDKSTQYIISSYCGLTALVVCSILGALLGYQLVSAFWKFILHGWKR